MQAAAFHPYDAILMDCQMPELNGYEATAAIRAQEGSGRHTPIIAMTAGARREDRERCLAEGMDGYLAKPFSKDALLALVARFMKSEPALPAPVPRVGQASATEITIDQAVFGELRFLGEGTKEDLVAELVDQFVHDTEPLLVQLREALEVGDALPWAASRTASRGAATNWAVVASPCPAGAWKGRRSVASCSTVRTICSRSRSTTKNCAAH